MPSASWPLAWGILIQTLLVVSLVALLESSSPDIRNGGQTPGGRE